LGTWLTTSFVRDDVDINRELKCLFTRTNSLTRRFARYYKQVKLRLFRMYCLCFYDIGLWTNYHCYSFNKFTSGYVKCMKVFFGFYKFSSVSTMLMQLGLHSCSTVMHNAKSTFVNRLVSCSNKLLQVIIRWVLVYFAILLWWVCVRVFLFAWVLFVFVCLWTRVWSDSNK